MRGPVLSSTASTIHALAPQSPEHLDVARLGAAVADRRALLIRAALAEALDLVEHHGQRLIAMRPSCNLATSSAVMRLWRLDFVGALTITVGHDDDDGRNARTGDEQHRQQLLNHQSSSSASSFSAIAMRANAMAVSA
jgi:hypothetical protein